MKKCIKYFIVIGIGLLIAFWVLLLHNIFSETDPEKILHAFCDAFFVPGVLITGFGLLVFANNKGSFDMLSYGLLMFINKFRRDINARKYKSLYEYKEAKSLNQKGFGYIVISGLGFLAISIIFMIIWSYNS